MRRWANPVFVALAAALVPCTVALVLLIGQQAEIRRQADETQLGSVANCVRANINSAIITLSAQRSRGKTPSDFRFDAIARNLYPLLDCKRSSESAGIQVRLTDEQAKRYVDIVRTGRAPIVKDGRVVGSRPSILAGVKTIQQVGRVP